jgi:hypothetical protein
MTVGTEPLARPWLGSAWLRFLDAPLEQPSTAGLAASALAIGVAFDFAMRAGVIGAAGAASVLLASVLLLASGRIRNPHAIALIAAAPLFGVFLLLRSSDWLLPLDVIAAGGLIGFGASLARRGSALDLTIPDMFGRVVRGGLQAISAPTFLFRGAFGTKRASRLGSVARGLVLVAPIVIILTALFTSADAVFASFFDIDATGIAQHAFLVTFGTLAMASLLRLASIAPADVPRVESMKLGAVESSVVLLALNGLLGAFAVARLVAASEGGHRVLSSAGLTYAEYARTGFFQLLAAAVIVIATLLALRATADLQTSRQRHSFTGLALGVVVLTLAVCASAFHRLVLYESAFGLTMLRLYVQTAIVWVGIVLVLLGLAVVLRDVRRAWLAPAAAIGGLALLLALNVFNPEAFVARHNVSHPPTTEGVDAAYLSRLSDDAVPAIASSARGTDPAARSLRTSICSTPPAPAGWASFNVARDRAETVRVELCP